MGKKNKNAQPVKNRLEDTSVMQVFQEGNSITKLSFIVFGLGNLINKQLVRGFIFLAIEISYLIYLFSFGIKSIGNFITLGTVEQGQVYNEALGIYEYSAGDDSMLCLLYGVITLVLTAAIIFVACMSAKSAYCTQKRKERGWNIPSFKDDIRSLKEENLSLFCQALNQNCTLQPEDYICKRWIDVPMPFSYITKELIQEFSLLEPFGKGNEKPLFAAKDIVVQSFRIVGQNHNAVKLLLLDKDNCKVDAVYFGDTKEFVDKIHAGSKISVLYYPSINAYRGVETIQITISGYQIQPA